MLFINKNRSRTNNHQFFIDVFFLHEPYLCCNNMIFQYLLEVYCIQYPLAILNYIYSNNLDCFHFEKNKNIDILTTKLLNSLINELY